MDHHTKEHLHESPKVVTWPLWALAVPSVIAGWFFVEPMLYGGLFGDSIFVLPEHDVLNHLGEHYTDQWGFIAHGVMAAPFWLAMGGIAAAWFLYEKRPDIPEMWKNKLDGVYKLLINKYYIDQFNDFFFAGGARGLGRFLWNVGDVKLIDGMVVNGSARTVGWISSIVRHVQTGYLYHYAFAMIIGLVAMVVFFVNVFN